MARKAFSALFLIITMLCLLAAGALADKTPKPTAVPTPTPIPTPLPTMAPPEREQIRTEDGAFPELNADGFLDHGEFVYVNEKDGIWRYCSPTLWIEIIRYQTKKPKLIWYEAEIRAAEGEAFHVLPYRDDQPMGQSAYPCTVAQKNDSVFACSTDYAFYRMRKKYQHPGILIRNYRVYSTRTYPSNERVFPNMDVLALWPNGDMQVFESSEHTAQEYLDMGVESTLAFGPIMIRDGEISPRVNSVHCESENPRIAVGMAERGHYWVIMAEGRSDRSDGISVPRLADLLFARGCTAALNLDGGGTAAITFMGWQITRNGNTTSTKRNARATTDLLSIGTSQLVPYNGK